MHVCLFTNAIQASEFRFIRRELIKAGLITAFKADLGYLSLPH